MPAFSRLFAFCILVLIASACATKPPASDPAALAAYKEANDPFEPLNRRIYNVNRKVDRAVIDPFIGGYRKVVPSFVRKRITNITSTMGEPVNFFNNTLQGSPKRAGRNLGRLVINATIGLAGMFDVAGKLNIESAPEDFGQTLGVWGAGEGPYLMIPLLGPSNIRDGVGFAVDSATDPFSYIISSRFGIGVFDRDAINLGLNGVGFVNTRERFDSQLDTLYEQEGDQYVFLRSAYRQQRRFAISNGAIAPNQEEDDLFDEEFEDIPQAALDLDLRSSIDSPVFPVTLDAGFAW